MVNYNYYLDKLFGIEVIRIFPREAIKYAKDYFQNKEIIALEIGTLKGENTKSMFKKLNISKIYLIDPYIIYNGLDRVYAYRSCKKEAIRRLNKFSDKINWIFKLSSEAIEDIKEKVDFIYIDGNHDYSFVKEDLENYWEILNMGGIMSGHDIQCEDVSRAVLEFARKKNLQVLFGERRDWWIIKC